VTLTQQFGPFSSQDCQAAKVGLGSITKRFQQTKLNVGIYGHLECFEHLRTDRSADAYHTWDIAGDCTASHCDWVSVLQAVLGILAADNTSINRYGFGYLTGYSNTGTVSNLDKKKLMNKGVVAIYEERNKTSKRLWYLVIAMSIKLHIPSVGRS
jgi:hypothetical protein